MRDSLRLLVVWLGIGVSFFSAGAEIGTGQLTNNLFVEGRGLDPKSVGTWISLYWLSFTIGRLVTGAIIDRSAGSGHRGDFNLVEPHAHSELDRPAVDGIRIIGWGSSSRRAGLGSALLPALAGVLSGFMGLEVIGVFLVIIGAITCTLHEFLIYRERRLVIAGIAVG
jgi:fucose permease